MVRLTPLNESALTKVQSDGKNFAADCVVVALQTTFT